MAKSPNGKNLRGWLTLVLAGAVLLVGITIAWAGQSSSVVRNTERIEKMEVRQTKMLDSLARIERKLGIPLKPNNPESEETER